MDAQLYHSFSLERDDSEFITTNFQETDIRKFRRRRTISRTQFACVCEDWGFINRSVQENAEDCPCGDCVERRYILSSICHETISTDSANCQLTFSKVHLLLVTYKITFRKYTRENMHLQMHIHISVYRE